MRILFNSRGRLLPLHVQSRPGRGLSPAGGDVRIERRHNTVRAVPAAPKPLVAPARNPSCPAGGSSPSLASSRTTRKVDP